MQQQIQTTPQAPNGTNLAHREAIDKIGFVHRRLPTGDRRNGSHFVHSSHYDQPIPEVLVVVTETHTTIEGWDLGAAESYQVVFDSNTPANLVNQAVSAAIQEAS